MGKKRVHELAKELGCSNADILDAAGRLDLGIKLSASAGLSDEHIEKISAAVGQPKPRTPLKLGLGFKPGKTAKPEQPAPEPAREPAEPQAPAVTGRVKTAAEVKREAKIKKRIAREAEVKQQKDEEAARREEKVQEKKKRKAAKKSAAKEETPEAVATQPEEKPEAPSQPTAPAPAPAVKPAAAAPAVSQPSSKGSAGSEYPFGVIGKIDLEDADPRPKTTAKKTKKKPKPTVTPVVVDEDETKNKAKAATPLAGKSRKPVYRMIDSFDAPELDQVRSITGMPDFRPRIRRRRPLPGRERTAGRRDRKRGRDERDIAGQVPQPPAVAEVTHPMSIRDFSQATGIKAQAIILKLLNEGIMSNINTFIEKDTIEYLAGLFEKQIEFKKQADIEDELVQDIQTPDDPNDLERRNPIVTFLGHVDHGKTSLLDRIREAAVASTESGGITQHTSAYIYSKDGKNIAFIDTPGHAVFTEMRIRGANVTDIVVLVIAADDGVMPQTREAYDHAAAAKVPIIVAMNKMDLPNADELRLKGQLAEMGLTPEDWGGKTQCAAVSAITGMGVDHLLDMIMLEAEMIELKANPKRPAQAVVLETHLSDSQGIVASVVVKNGTANRGDCFLCGKTFGRIRHIWNPDMKPVTSAGPSTPAVITGFNSMPAMGDHLYVMNDLQKAKAIAEKRNIAIPGAHIEKSHVTMATLFDNISRNKLREFNIILKADAKGSVEAIIQGLKEIGNKEVAIRIVHSGIGGINESDVMLADVSDAVIIGFHVAPEIRIGILAEEKGVEIRRYHVIYEIFKELEEALSGMLEPAKVEETLGHVVVRKTFSISSIGTIAGCFVTSGVARKMANIRVLRDNIEIFDGKIESLKRQKDDASEVKENYECGIKVQGFDDIKEGDTFEIYIIKEVKRKLTGTTTT